MERNRVKPELAATAGQWLYVDCNTIVKFPGRGGVTVRGLDCYACGNSNLRFFHTLKHQEDGRFITVGIECARVLLGPDDWEIPALAENEVKRKEGWRVYYSKPGRCTANLQDLMNRGKL